MLVKGVLEEAATLELLIVDACQPYALAAFSADAAPKELVLSIPNH